MLRAQLELSFGPGSRPGRRATRRLQSANAHWWFARMRQIVDHAPDLQPAEAPSLPSTRYQPEPHAE